MTIGLTKLRKLISTGFRGGAFQAEQTVCADSVLSLFEKKYDSQWGTQDRWGWRDSSGQIMCALVGHGKEFRFYTKYDRKEATERF